MSTAEAVRAVFERRRRQGFEPLLAGVTGSYRFDIQGVGSFFVSVDDGHLTVIESARDADCVIACEADDFVRLTEGRQNMLTAAMQGLVQIHGDLALAQKLHGILPTERQPEAQP